VDGLTPPAPSSSGPVGELEQVGDRGIRLRSEDADLRDLGTVLDAYAEDVLDLLRRGDVRSVSPWVDAETVGRVLSAAAATDGMRLRPIHEALEGAVPYDTIRLVLAQAAVDGDGPDLDPSS